MAVCAFGRFTLELETGELRKDGRPVKLHPQPAGVLRLLAQRPGVIVSREEIKKELWPQDTHVDFDLGINSCIKQIRTALEDDAEHPRFIETVPRRGYRFIAPIDGVSKSVDAQKAFLRSRVWAVLTLLALGIGAAALLTFSPAPEEPTPPEVRPLTSHVGSEIDPALSPDGYQVAYAGKGNEDDQFHIFVHLIDGDEPLQLTRAEADDYSPVWSPDGTRIAFLRERSGEFTNEIFIVPALGGRERSLGTILARRETGPLWEPGLDWSPDGRFLATVDRASSEEQVGVTLVSVDTGERRTITHPPTDGTRDNHPRFTPDGSQVAFIRQRNRGAGHSIQSLLLDSSDIEPQVVVKGLIHDLAWAVSRSTILFTKFHEGRHSIWKYDLGSSSPSRLNFGENALSVTISGNRLVYDEAIRLNCDIWRMEGPASEEKRPPAPLIVSTRMELAPRYSPDGGKIAIGSSRSGRLTARICNSDGSDCYQPTEIQGGVQWSPDGKRTLIRGKVGGGERGFYVTDVETNVSRRLPVFGRSPQWSRDGQWIYYSDAAQDNSQIWKIPAEGGESIRVTQNGGILFAQEADDGFLYYTKRRQLSSEKWDDIWRIPIDGGKESPFLENLFVEGRNCTMWRNHLVYRHWVDGEGIPYIAPGRRSVIDMMDLETGEVTRLHTFDPEDRFCFGTAVSPDGQSILYAPQVSSGGHDLVLVENYQ